MSGPEISGIAPFFIVNRVSTAPAFYRYRLGFDITVQGIALGCIPCCARPGRIGGRIPVARRRIFRTTEMPKNGLRGFELKGCGRLCLIIFGRLSGDRLIDEGDQPTMKLTTYVNFLISREHAPRRSITMSSISERRSA
jgi:hypothetical protein